MAAVDNTGTAPTRVITINALGPDGKPIVLEEVQDPNSKPVVPSEVVFTGDGDALEDPGLQPMVVQDNFDIPAPKDLSTSKYSYYADTKEMSKARLECVRDMLTGKTGRGQGLHKRKLLPGQVRNVFIAISYVHQIFLNLKHLLYRSLLS